MRFPPGPHDRRRTRRRSTIAVLATATALATVVYGVQTTVAQPRPHHAQTIQVAADAQDAQPALPYDVQAMSQEAQQLTASTSDPNDLIKKAEELLKKYGIDPTPVEKFLQQAAAEASPRQLATDAAQWLIDDGVDKNDFNEIQSLMQQVPADPVSAIQKLATLAVKYWWAFPIIVAVAVAVIVFGASSGKGQQDSGNQDGSQDGQQTDEDENGCSRQQLQTYLDSMEAQGLPPTTAIGYPAGDTTGPQYQFTVGNWSDSVIAGKPKAGSPWGVNLVNRAKARLQPLSRQGKPVDVGGLNHAEPKLAEYMYEKSSNLRDQGQASPAVDHMCVAINNNDGVCKYPPNETVPGCRTTLPYVLGAGQEMDVYWQPTKGVWDVLPFVGTSSWPGAGTYQDPDQ